MTKPAGESVVVALLGEIALRRDGTLTAVPGARSRLLLAALALRPGRARSAAALIDDVWGEQPPRAPMNALHTQVSRLRAALPEGALEIGPAGYRLILRPDQVDLTLAAELLRDARRRQDSGDAAGCVQAVAQARRLWRGEPSADLPPGQVADELSTAAAARLRELDALELSARRSGGDLDGALRIARRLAAEQPLDEPAQLTLMRLLASTGRGNEALESFAAFRTRLGDHLGADPGRELIELNTAILRGEPLNLTGSGDPVGAENRTAADTGASSANGPAGRPAHPDDRTVQAEPQTGTATGTLMATGLRAAPNALLGRDDDLSALGRLLPESRVVTVLGPGGTGKTRFANEVGVRAAQHLPVVLVELASVRADGTEAGTRAELEGAIAAALGLSELPLDATGLRKQYVADAHQRLREAAAARQLSSGELDELAALRGHFVPEARQRLREALAARPMLLILDNCEHLIETVAVIVADLIGACPRLTVLTTSRSPLMITAETVYPLPPLAIDAAGSPATDLFMARARAVRPSVRLDPEVVAQLCRTLDGLPLAIELAAARVRTMSVEEISARLTDRFALLRSGDRSSPERHRTLHAVIDWSWNLLEAEQQLALRRLCRFPAGFTLSAAAGVAGDIDDVATAVDGLVNQSLLTVLEDERLGTRYRMLETVREYGEEQLARAGESDQVMARMVLWARHFAITAVGTRDDTDQVWLALAVAAEVDNLLAVLRYSLERRDAVTVYTVFPVLGSLWVIRGSHVEVTGWAPRLLALDPAGAPDEPSPELQIACYLLMFLHLAYLGDDLRGLARLRIRVRRLLLRDDLSAHVRFLGRVMVARADGKGGGRLLAAGVRSPDRATRASALMLRANIRENMGDVRGSTVDAIRALRVIPPTEVWTVAMVCRHLGGVCGQIARYDEAVTYYERCLALLRQLGTSEESIETRAHLAAALVGTGQLDRARHQIDLALGPDTAAIDGMTSTPNHLAGTVAGAAAELALAEGDIAGGLRRHWRVLELYGWPDPSLGPGPGSIMVGAMALDAHVLYGAVADTGRLPDQLADNALAILSQLHDLPQLGCAACAIGSYLVVGGKAPARGLELLALASRVRARQDYPTMRIDRHLDAARAQVGADRVGAALNRATHLSRKHAAARIMELLRKIQDGR
ncbi:AfsR/SARP family transcriptional regulator [Nocardia goodfellowii]|uniref:ATPase/DNA-binding SARP family transcriptional activator n=1 Tax=Nocardia goodfellowii TaxID=882446 RepID=A0ABS4QDP4_9NOCA|nr:BTAD domain-containing putative transcriptional regulator [Nocardia goodfellowii]MBP2188816.1 putative ATPase/DNA-binding SARP family transcriptional activator [Nocardia goodfellowii]